MEQNQSPMAEAVTLLRLQRGRGEGTAAPRRAQSKAQSDAHSNAPLGVQGILFSLIISY